MDCVIIMQPKSNYKTIIDQDVILGYYHGN